MTHTTLRLAAALLFVLAVAGSSPQPVSAAGLATGFTDTLAFERDSPIRQLTLPRAKEARASYVRIFAFWVATAPQQPPGRAEARNPAWIGYRWSALDARVRDIVAAGLAPIVVIDRAPAWAEEPGRPPVSESLPAGTWKPSPEALADFAAAIAQRYSGSFPDPLNPAAALPRVRAWQVWNEPNLYNDLTPQWQVAEGKLVAFSPSHYRRMLRAAFTAIKAAARDNLVVTGGLGPFGDLDRGSRRMPPALFARAFLCVTGRKNPVGRKCPDGPATFDVLAHHPYPIGPPRRHAPNADDVVVADFDRLKKPLVAAQKAGNLSPRGPKRLWATELSWDSIPDPDGLSLDTQARYLSGAFSTLADQGVDTVIWFNLRDQPEGASWGETLQSGVYLRSDDPLADKPKPSYTAFRFPFTAHVSGRGSRAKVWGLAPSAGRVLIERRVGARWRRALVLRARANRLFGGRLGAARGAILRARRGTEKSLPWTVVR